MDDYLAQALAKMAEADVLLERVKVLLKMLDAALAAENPGDLLDDD